MTTAEFRAKVRAAYPHVRVRVQTTSFSALGYGSAQCLTIEGAHTIEEKNTINGWATEAGIVKDGSIFCAPSPERR